MLLWLCNHLAHYYHVFAVVQYITLRAILGAITALIVALGLGPWVIKRLMYYKVGQVVRQEGPESHFSKSGTPTMGGVLILLAFAIALILWGDWANHYVVLTIIVTLGYGVIGGVDDFRKLVYKDSRGMGSRNKFLAQSVIALAAAFYLYFTATQPVQTSLVIPFIKNWYLPLGWVFIPFVYFVIVGSSNAVNLTDGLDGLAGLLIILVTAGLAIFVYLSGNIEYAHYLQIPYIAHAGELAVVAAVVIGASLGFLWFNSYPAQIFMGDIGSLSLGAFLGILAVIIRQEIVLLIMGGIFVAETISVMLQVVSFKSTGKRIFRMAPLHHHFELKGWPEPKVVMRFMIITVILVLIGLATLKLR